jgi:hypothetical protein
MGLRRSFEPEPNWGWPGANVTQVQFVGIRWYSRLWVVENPPATDQIARRTQLAAQIWRWYRT